MWVTLLRGLVALVLGVSVLLTAKTHRAVANYIAIYWLLGSVVTLRWALAQRGRRGGRPASMAALAGIAAGVVVLLRFLLADVLSVLASRPGAARRCRDPHRRASALRSFS